MDQQDQTIGLARAISVRLNEAPARTLMRYLANGDAETAAFTCAEIDAAARRTAAALLAAGLGGRRVLLVMESGPDFLRAITGCLYAGVVAIPASEPRPGVSLQRLDEIAAASGAAAILVTARIAASLERGGSDVLRALPMFDVADLIPDESPDECPGFERDPRAPAIVQYTSGSTARPRGVVLDGACILANIRALARGMGLGDPEAGETETVVNWMPHYHDMGLVGKILAPLINGYEVIHMPPLAFVQRPARWLRAISRYRATASGAPAFAFDLCAQRIPDAEIDALDLSSWRTAFCGAEPVFAATLDAFRRRFARAGLRPEAVFTCYGLAETTLYAAGAHGSAKDVAAPAEPSSSARAPCFHDAASREAIRIVDARGVPVAEGEEGEIWVSSPSVASGYLDDPDATRETFGARLATDDGRLYLRTGDLARLDGDRMTVTGRIKDVLIAAGVNVAAADVERFATAGEPQLNRHGAAAFQGPDALGAPLVLMVERERSAAIACGDEDLVRRIRKSVSDALGVGLDEVCILRPGALPRTTSGKIRRRAAADAWAAGRAVLTEAG